MPNYSSGPEKQLEQLPADPATFPSAAIAKAMDAYLSVVRDSRSPNTAKAYGQALRAFGAGEGDDRPFNSDPGSNL